MKYTITLHNSGDINSPVLSNKHIHIKRKHTGEPIQLYSRDDLTSGVSRVYTNEFGVCLFYCRDAGELVAEFKHKGERVLFDIYPDIN